MSQPHAAVVTSPAFDQAQLGQQLPVLLPLLVRQPRIPVCEKGADLLVHHSGRA